MAGKLPAPIGTKAIYSSLAGNPDQPGTMAVECGFDTGRKVAWVWKRNAQGKISTDGAVTADIAMPELMMDPASFFGKTAAEQVQTVFSVCDVDDDVFSIKSVLGRLGEVIASPVAVRDTTMEQIRKMMGTAEPEYIQSWFDVVIQNLTASQKSARDSSKAKKGAFEAYRYADPEAQPPQDVSAVLAEKRALRDSMASNPVDQSHINRLKTEIAQFGNLSVGLNCIKSDLVELEEDVITDQSEREELRDDLCASIGSKGKRLSQVQAVIDNAKTKLAELEHLEACPYCKSSKKGWKTVVKNTLEETLSASITERDLLSTELDTAKLSIQKIIQYESLLSQKTQIEKLQARENEILAELGTLENRPAATGPSPELIQEIANLEAEQLRFAVFKTNRAKQGELEQDLLKAQCEEAVYKAVLAIVIEEQDKVVDKVFGKVLNVARHFTDGLLNSRLEFVSGELGRRVSNLDTKQGNTAAVGSWIPFAGFSGTERLLALAGFSVALTGDAPCKLVVLDEMGNLDLARRTEVAMRMLSLVESGVIDQAILIDVDERPYVPLAQRPGFKLMAV